MGVIVPNPTVETEDGSVSVSNVKKIEITNGDLTADGGRVVSIDTSGTATSAAGSNTQVQVNDGGNFGASAGLTYDGSTLSANNALDLGAIGSGGRIECSQNNQNLQIKHTGTGKVEIVNATNNVNTNVQITGPGTGTANLTLSGPSGGITFTDGTTQTTAASSGGGVVVHDPSQATSGSYVMCAGRLFPIGNNSVQFWSVDTARNYAWPFYPASSGDVDSMMIRVGVAAAGSTARCAIWDSDGTGNTPGTLLGYADISGAATGSITQTTTSATISLTAGQLYFYSVMNVGTGSLSIYSSSNTYNANGSAEVGNLDNGGSSLEQSSGWATTFTFNYANRENAALVGIAVS